MISFNNENGERLKFNPMKILVIILFLFLNQFKLIVILHPLLRIIAGQQGLTVKPFLIFQQDLRKDSYEWVRELILVLHKRCDKSGVMVNFM